MNKPKRLEELLCESYQGKTAVRLPGGVQQDVRRLQIAMQDAALMGVMDRSGHRRQQRAAFRCSAMLAARTRSLPCPFRRCQAAPLDQLHAEEVLAFVFADLIDGHDVRMIQVGGGLGFGAKALHVRRRSQFARPGSSSGRRCGSG